MRLVDKLLLSGHAGEPVRDAAIRLLAGAPRWLTRAAVQAHVARKEQALRGATAPQHLFFYLTNRCNLACHHCFCAREQNASSAELTLTEIERVARSLRGSDVSVALCGGEPLLRPDLDQILLALYHQGGVRHFCLTTNGFFPQRTARTLRRFARDTRGYMRVLVSLDGLREVHNRVRGHRESFDRAEATISQVCQLSRTHRRIRPVINAVVSDLNVDHFLPFARYVRGRYRCEFMFSFLRQADRDVVGIDRALLWNRGPSEDRFPDLAQARALVRAFAAEEPHPALLRWRSKIKDYHLRMVRDRQPCVRCQAPQSFATLYADGGLSLCEVVRPFAQVQQHDYDLIRAWRSPAADLQRQQLSRCHCTYFCALAASMQTDVDTVLDVLEGR